MIRSTIIPKAARKQEQDSSQRQACRSPWMAPTTLAADRSLGPVCLFRHGSSIVTYFGRPGAVPGTTPVTHACCLIDNAATASGSGAACSITCNSAPEGERLLTR